MRKKLNFDMSLDAMKAHIRKETALCIVAILTAVVINVVFTFLRSPENHTLLLIGNIVSDVLTCWFVLYDHIERISPMKKMYTLKRKNRQCYAGVVAEISQSTVRHMGLDCHAVKLDGKCLFLPEFMPQPEVGSAVSCDVVASVIVEVTYA